MAAEAAVAPRDGSTWNDVRGLDVSYSSETHGLPPPIAAFLDDDYPPLEPLLGPLTLQQIVLVYGPPGVGKTMFGLALAHALAGGHAFLGWAPVRRAKVLYVDGEMAAQMLQDRLRGANMAQDYLRIANMGSLATDARMAPMNLCLEEGQAVLDGWIDGAGSEVVVLDNLMSLAWLGGVSMVSDEYWQPIRRFACHQRALGRTLVIMDHTNANNEIYGTKTKLWQADLALELSPIAHEEEDSLLGPAPTRLRLRFSKVRGSQAETGQKVVTLGEVGKPWDWSDGREYQKARAKDLHAKGMTISEIATELKEPRSTVHRWATQASHKQHRGTSTW